ncbi:hypothetical protein FAZ15_16025 [Sphingobacterium olei]|uniref:Uncharacterized protein n=1 Tax=Sphingobacterium olei TaxID=2571155 RepID=A0A4U0NKY5_9SPHI|nr:hypothetical protein [Sphingobacterium olei]TJZ54967.1 hypothetical protein FAZ15_16025 [Sphingobacterium olei]
MKSQLKLWKTGLVALFLLVLADGAYAQLVAPVPSSPVTNKTDLNLGTLDDGVLPITDQPNTILFYKENAGVSETGLTLRASLVDNSSVPLTFTSYIWYKLAYDGVAETPVVVAGETTRDLVLGALEPGYYKYRVYGLVEDGTVTCQSDEFQDIVFFVLRPVDPTANPEIGSITQFCENVVPTTGLQLNASLVFDANVAYQGGYPNADVDQFEMTYRWYAINIDAPGTQIELPGNVNTVSGASNSLTITDYSNLLVPGTYHFYVEVQYSEDIKERENRPHALWTAQVGGSVTPYELVVTPKPGRPTITIEAVND